LFGMLCYGGARFFVGSSPYYSGSSLLRGSIALLHGHGSNAWRLPGIRRVFAPMGGARRTVMNNAG
ncbi:MAG: hypothetical protein NW703_10005, partial [Nitrospiraceae bacterium]